MIRASVLYLLTASSLSLLCQTQQARMPADPRFARLPMVFEPSGGSRTDYSARGASYSVRVSGSEATIRAAGREKEPARVTVAFAGAARNLRPQPVDPRPGRSNYLLGNDPKRWRINVPQYRAVRYRGIYPGVNILYYGNQNRLEYDLEVSAGADLSRIEMEVSGAKHMAASSSGDLTLITAAGEVILHKPLVYQMVNAGRRQIAASYRKTGTNRLRFDVGAHDERLPLVIDPVISFSAVIGVGYAAFRGVALDRDNNIYMTGRVYSTDSSAVRITPGGSDDAFVGKLSADGSTLLFSTFFGGSSGDSPTAIAVDATGAVSVAGYTYSTDFPLKNPVQSAMKGDRDVFVARLNSAGNALTYSTYLGGKQDDYPVDLQIDPGTGRVLVAGYTLSADFPVTPGAFQTVLKGYGNGFVASLTPAGALWYSTLLGGSMSDWVSAIAVDASGAAWVTGETSSSDFPFTADAYQRAGFGGYIAKLSPDGQLVYSTHFGSPTSWTQPYAIALDAAGNIYIAGSEQTGNLPVTPGVVQGFSRGLAEGFISKLNSSATAVIFSTYLGGSGGDSPHGLTVDRAGNIIVSGFTYSSDFPTVSALQPGKVGAAAGVQVSTNGGATWAGVLATGSGLPSYPFSAAILRRSQSSLAVVYATTVREVWRSTDGGASFGLTDVGYTSGQIMDLAVHPSNPLIVFAATASGVEASADGGKTFSRRTSGLPNEMARSIAFAPSDGNILYAGYYDSGLYKSTDGGSNWARVTSYAGEALRIAVDPANASKVYVAGTMRMSASADGGASWTSTATVCCAADLKVAPGKVYAAFGDTFYRSTNSAASWSSSPAGTTISSFDVDTSNPDVLYAGTPFGILKSSDSGAAWTRLNAGTPLGQDTILAVLTLPNKVLVGFVVNPNGFIAKLNPNATSILYSSYFGLVEGNMEVATAARTDGDVVAFMGAYPASPGAYVSPNREIGLIHAGVMRIGDGAGACSVNLDRTSENWGANPVLSRLLVSPGAGCAWAATTSTPWITFSGPNSGSGIGYVEYMLAQNTGSARTGTITINGRTLTVNQAGPSAACAIGPIYPVPPFGSQAGSYPVFLSVTPGCAWAASSTGAWLTATPPSGTSSDGTVTLNVTANIAGAGRTATLTLTSGSSSSSVTVYQSGQGCTKQLSVASATVGAAGGTATVPFVSNPSNCEAWAASQPSWATPTGAAIGVGSANVGFQIAANPWDTPRVGTITVGGLDFTVSQAAGSQCASAPITPMVSVNSSLTSSDCPANNGSPAAKHYTFTGTAGQQIAVELTSPTIPTWLTLSRPDGTPVQSGYSWNRSRGSRVPQSGFYTLPSPGIYTIEVASFTAPGTGAFQLQLLPACDLSLPLQGVAVPSGGGARDLSAAILAGACTVTSFSPDWIAITASNPAGLTATLSAGANTKTDSRMGVISVGGKPFFVSQSGGTTFAFTPASASVPAGGWTGSFSVAQTPTGPNFYAVALQPWIHLRNGQQDLPYVALADWANTVTYSVDPNTTGISRTGQIAAGSQVFTVNQDGGPVSTGLRFVPVPPCRVADTRLAPGPFGGPQMQGGTSRSFPIPQSACNIPSNAQAYSLNVTVVPAGPLSYLTAWPAGQTQPLVSTLNSFNGDVVANAAIVPAGTGGAISVFVTDRTDVVLDINGYFAPGGASQFYPVSPCRIFDSRMFATAIPGIPGGTSRNFAVPQSACNIPATAQAYALNFTVVPMGPLSYLTAWPAGQPQPFVSTLNSFKGEVVANAAIVPAGTDGAISVYVTDRTDLVIDINGYFGPPGGAGAMSFYTSTPCRVADTRLPAGPFGGPQMKAASSRDFAVPFSACNIPATAKAYSMNVTVVPPGPLSYLTAWPTGLPQPLVSTLNSFLGKVVANAAIIPAGTNGAISVFVTDRTDVVLDINGFFAP